jgi:hypothetical protein
MQSRGIFDYQPGDGFYQLTKREKIQPQKKIAIREKATGRIYTGPEARQPPGPSQYGGHGQAGSQPRL